MDKNTVNQKIDRDVASQSSSSSKTVKKPVILFVVVLFVVGIGLFAIIGKELTFSEGTLLTRHNQNKILQEVADNEYLVVMSSHWHFADGSSVSEDAYVENNAANTNNVYFIITLDETGEVVFISPTLELGKSMKDIKLATALAKGTYSATISFYLLDASGNSTSMIPMKLTLTIEQ